MHFPPELAVYNLLYKIVCITTAIDRIDATRAPETIRRRREGEQTRRLEPSLPVEVEKGWERPRGVTI